MNNLDLFLNNLSKTPLAFWGKDIKAHYQHNVYNSNHGQINKWKEILTELPLISGDVVLTEDIVTFIQSKQKKSITGLKSLLLNLGPWRKGPFQIDEILIDSEWQCYLKWNRLKDHISPLKDKLVLDVGSGNGYYSYRMVGDGAKLVCALEPWINYIYQFLMLDHFFKVSNMHVIPIGLEAVPEKFDFFDSVFSMGVLYHRRSPIEHLKELKNCLKKGGELILETLIIDGDDRTVLFPEDRYAAMRNVWFVPSASQLEVWLQRVGFSKIKKIDETVTTSVEQRTTSWYPKPSLKDFLDFKDSSKTVEGYPAPKRVIYLAKK